MLQLLLHPIDCLSDHTAAELVEGMPQQAVLGKLSVFEIQKSGTVERQVLFSTEIGKNTEQCRITKVLTYRYSYASTFCISLPLFSFLILWVNDVAIN